MQALPRLACYPDSLRMRRSQGVIAVLLVLCALAFALGAYLGRAQLQRQVSSDPESVYNLQREVEALTEALGQANGDLEMVRTRHEVDRQALELVRRDIAAQKDRAAELEEGLRFYRSLMAPGDVKSGLSLRPPELVRKGPPGHYALRLVVQQKARKHEMLTGLLTVTIVGLAAGLEVSYPLEEVSPDFAEDAHALKFRYFQAIEAEIVLPEGFSPTGIAVAATATRPTKTELEQLFPWQLQERFTHVGK